METAVEQVLRSPRARLYVDEISRVLDAEQEARERFYDQLTEDGHVEFINGKVIVHSPARNVHNIVTANLLTVLRTFVQVRDLGLVGAEKYLITLTRNDYEPDISFWPKEVAQSFTPDQLQFPAPALIVEVTSPSTASLDRGVKFDDYAAHGVREYWIVDADAQAVEQYKLHDGNFKRLSDTDQLRSEVVRGFQIPAEAIFDPAKNLAALKKMIG